MQSLWATSWTTQTHIECLFWFLSQQLYSYGCQWMPKRHLLLPFCPILVYNQTHIRCFLFLSQQLISYGCQWMPKRHLLLPFCPILVYNSATEFFKTSVSWRSSSRSWLKPFTLGFKFKPRIKGLLYFFKYCFPLLTTLLAIKHLPVGVPASVTPGEFVNK